MVGGGDGVGDGDVMECGGGVCRVVGGGVCRVVLVVLVCVGWWWCWWVMVM